MKEKKITERIWELDALRGFLILAVLIDHLVCTVQAFCINGYYNIDSYRYVCISDPLRCWFYWGDDGIIHLREWTAFLIDHCTFPSVNTFFIISGVCCLLSKNNLRRSLITFAAGLFVAIFTKGLAIWTGDPTRFIRFGVLLCYAFCQFAYVFFFEKIDSKWLLLCIVPIFIIGYYLRYVGVAPMRLPIFYIFGVPQIGDQSSDFWPVFPMLGWFLLGVVLGRKVYSERRTLVPNKWAEKLTRPLQWMGRRSGIIYVSHIVIYTALFCGIGYLFHLL